MMLYLYWNNFILQAITLVNVIDTFNAIIVYNVHVNFQHAILYFL